MSDSESQDPPDYGDVSDDDSIVPESPREKDTLMQECAYEWENLVKYANIIWNYSKEKNKITSSIPSIEEKEKLLQYIFNVFNDCFNFPIIVPVEDPLQWIYNWKDQRGIVYNWGKGFSNENFQKLIINAVVEEANKEEANIVDIPKQNEILSTIKDQSNELKIGTVEFKEPDNNEIDELIKNLKKIEISDINDIILSKKLKNLALTEAYKISPVGAIGVNLDNKGIITTKFSDNIIFKAGYKDPHFDFLGDKVEYWRPQQHMITGGKVYNVKDEIFKTTKRCKKIYLKIQNVNVKINGEDKKFYYFRKFIDFNDFLKVWQINYIRNYYQMGTKMNQETNIKKLEYYVDRRHILFNKINDINTYFSNQINDINTTEKTKLNKYVNDNLVIKFLKKRDIEPEKTLSKKIKNERREDYKKLKQMLESYDTSKKRRL